MISWLTTREPSPIQVFNRHLLISDNVLTASGRTHTIPALDVDLDDVRATYETNVFGVMAMCQAFASLLIPARGLIVNISSVSSVVPYLFGAAYSSTKGALNTYSRVLRMELRPFNVRVMVSMTGTVRSNVANHFDRILPPDSLYQPVDDIFKERLTFSQNNGTIPADQFARRLVSQALKGEGYLGGWFGRTPDWMWAGGLAKTAWLLSLLPRTIAESIVGVYFRLSLIKRRIDEAKRRAGA